MTATITGISQSEESIRLTEKRASCVGGSWTADCVYGGQAIRSVDRDRSSCRALGPSRVLSADAAPFQS